MKKNVNMRDIAEKLGISAVTVSKALSGKDGVGEDLRARIKIVANELGYRKNVLAIDIREGLTHNVGILFSGRHIGNGTPCMRMQQALIKKLLANGYYGIMEIIDKKEEDLATLPQLICDNKVDGIVILGQMRPAYLNVVSSIGLPFLFLDFYYENLHSDAVISDNVYGGHTLTNHLVSLGHQNIGFVGNPLNTGVVMDRFLGYYKALLENGLTVRHDWFLPDCDDFGDSIDIKLPEEMPTAFVCCNSESAFRFMRILSQAGFPVPDSASVVGFDDDVFASISKPQLTTFAVDYEMMATTAADSIVRKIKDEDFHLGRKIINGKLVIRESSVRISKPDWVSLNSFG